MEERTPSGIRQCPSCGAATMRRDGLCRRCAGTEVQDCAAKRRAKFRFTCIDAKPMTPAERHEASVQVREARHYVEKLEACGKSPQPYTRRRCEG